MTSEQEEWEREFQAEWAAQQGKRSLFEDPDMECSHGVQVRDVCVVCLSDAQEILIKTVAHAQFMYVKLFEKIRGELNSLNAKFN